MVFKIDKSRRIPLDRNTFDFTDMNEVLEWVDFFEPADAQYTVEQFEKLTGKNFRQLYKVDFGKEYVPPTDDEIMAEPAPEPSPQFKQEVLFYWEQLYTPGPKNRPFMAITSETTVDTWNQKFAPKAYALFQQDKAEKESDRQDDGSGDKQTASQQQLDEASTPEVARGSSTSTVPTLTVVAQRTVVDTLAISQSGAPPETAADDSQPGPSVDYHHVRGTYLEGLPSPRRTRLGSKLDAVLHQRIPQENEDIVDLTTASQTERRRYAADKEYSCVSYLNRFYAVRATDTKAAMRRLQGFTT